MNREPSKEIASGIPECSDCEVKPLSSGWSAFGVNYRRFETRFIYIICMFVCEERVV